MLLLWVFAAVMRSGTSVHVTNITNIPTYFMIGTASSAYQVEGAWNESGKGASIWDTFVHSQSDMIKDHSNGDIAADSYNKWQDDVKILNELHVNFYRFSISWARILPTGERNSLNKDGIDYYNNLINELTKNNITCMVVMYHWDLPQKLQDLGGWANPVIADFFEDYARVLYENFGDKVKWWITIVEPNYVLNGYNVPSKMAPAIDSPQVGTYLAVHTLLLAHAKAFHVYKNEFFRSQQGRVGIVLDGDWFEPADKLSRADQEAAEFVLQYQLGMFANPIFSSEGDYPKVVKNRIETQSKIQGYPVSRLRNLTAAEVAFIRGSSDFFGLNYYTTRLVKPGNWTDMKTAPDRNVTLLVDANWPATVFPEFQVVPTGIRSILNWVKQSYNNPSILITENGYPDKGGYLDIDRVKFIVRHMDEVMKAINEDGCNVTGYAVWSFIDNFEWNVGYTQKFGLYSVDFNNIDRPRTPKSSAYYFADIIKNRKLPGYIIKDSGEMEIDLTFFDNIQKQPVFQSSTNSAAFSFIGYKSQFTQVCFTDILPYVCLVVITRVFINFT